MDLTELTIETFRDRVGETFTDDASGTELTLVEVTDLTAKAGTVPSENRTPFSLMFTEATETVVPQGIRSLRHAELGELALFVVPIAQDAEGVRHQAVFS